MIAITPFIYQNVPGSEDLHGAESLPTVSAVMQKMAREILAGEKISLACAEQEPRCEGRDLVRRNSCGKELGRVTKAPQCAPADPKKAGPVQGWLDSVTLLENGWVRLAGWACAKNYNASIKIEVYADKPAEAGGKLIVSDSANRDSEAAVRAACETGAQHRFITDLHPDLEKASKGQRVFIYGLHPNGKGRSPLNGSGQFAIP